MPSKKLLAKIAAFHKLATKTADVLAELSQLETFKDRVDYAEKHLEHLSSGSSRVIYLTPEKEVLKLAKNERGVAQNKVEANPKMKSQYINKTLKADPNGYWKTSPYLDKITEKEFEKMTGITFKDFGEAIEYGLHKARKKDKLKEPKNFEAVSQLELYQELLKTALKTSLASGDLKRISSWGRNEKHPILLDAGLSLAVYEEFYDSSTGKAKSTS